MGHPTQIDRGPSNLGTTARGGLGGRGPHDVSLVELALEVVDDIGAGGEVGRHEDVGPVARPPRVVLVVVRRRGDPLQPLRISAGARVPLTHRRRESGSSRLPFAGILASRGSEVGFQTEERDA